MLESWGSFFKKKALWLPIHEAILIGLLLFVFNNFLQYNERVIQADGLGYYTYLPAAFIYGDLNFEFTDTLQTEFYVHKEAHAGIIRDVNERSVNKYFVGTAIAQAPFFLMAHMLALNSDHYAADGYSGIYQKTIFYAALFWTMMGLYFLRLSLMRFNVNSWWIFWIQLALLMASSIPNYIVVDASFSHVYSFGLISIWSYLIIAHNPNKPYSFLWIGLVLGLIVLIRPINIIILAFIPFLLLLSGKKINDFFSNRPAFLLGLLIFGCIVLIQPLIWFLQSGQWFVRSYGAESFDFSQPHIIDFLFSYRKGFFVYAPIFFLMILLASLFWVQRKLWSQLVSFYAAFLLLVYVLSSWWYWSYGFSFGSRVMIDFYVFFALATVPFFQNANVFLKWLKVPLVCFASYVSLVQTYQYKNYILSWDSMTKTDYWSVFLKTDKKYQGYLWQQEIDPKMIQAEIFSNPNISIEQLYQEAYTELIIVDKPDQKLAVVLNGSCSYKKGINRFMVSVEDSLGANQYYHELEIFKGSGKENYSGPFELTYHIHPLQPGVYKLVLFVYREEDIRCFEPIALKMYALQ